MKVFYFILGKANKDRPNGVNQVIAGLCKYLTLNGVSLRVTGFASNTLKQGEVIQRDKFKLKAYSLYNTLFLKDIITNIKWADIIHIHGIYNLKNIFIGMLAKKYSVPYVITLHNGFSPGLRSIKKRIFDFIVQKTHIENAAAIHVLALEESTEILQICSPKKIIYAPNGVDLDDIKNLKKKEDFNLEKNSEITIGFLGRVSKEKNIFNLVKAIGDMSEHYQIKLLIAGPDSPYLRYICKHNKNVRIDWVGPKYSNEKFEFIKSLDIFIHPSIADVFSISAMEVLSIGTPLIIARSSKASHFFNSNSFFMCEPTRYGIKVALSDAIKKQSLWKTHSENGIELVNKKFNWNSASLSLKKGYEEILHDK